ncbi:hypothetical protein TCAL_01396 [Tigriopus californicus]|uniref:Uncharacterized protein n=1 Tax=Tigriopus californicus TaxID=6832 RepID=A0A553NUW5_TIGCA|nr:uncharacterized protein LOC131879212 [Tigriopus californicus]XP_059081458.1 uncharacterized protein LOC131879212 [Tigriopus californicus]TRY69222.1 hypothetical protein TCAL_01396 [Tigriopus californicus]
MSTSTLYKADRSHSEVGDTLRYFNSVSASKSWCGDEFYQGDSYLKKITNKKKKSRSNSSSSQYLGSKPGIALNIRNNSIGGCHFDRILDESLLSEYDLRQLNQALQSHSAPISIKGSQASSREIISIVLHPPDEELSEGLNQEEHLEEVHLICANPSVPSSGGTHSAPSSLDCPSCQTGLSVGSTTLGGDKDKDSNASSQCSCVPVANNSPSQSQPQLTSNPLLLDAIAAMRSEDSAVHFGFSPDEREDSIGTTTVVLPAQVLASLRRQDSSRSYLRNQPFLTRMLPCMKSPTFDNLNAEDSLDVRLDLGDDELANTYRDTLAKTKQKYLVMDASTWTDRIVTGSLILMTMIAILGLFWFQNFGPGFHFSNH